MIILELLLFLTSNKIKKTLRVRFSFQNFSHHAFIAKSEKMDCKLLF